MNGNWKKCWIKIWNNKLINWGFLKEIIILLKINIDELSKESLITLLNLFNFHNILN